MYFEQFLSKKKVSWSRQVILKESFRFEDEVEDDCRDYKDEI